MAHHVGSGLKAAVSADDTNQAYSTVESHPPLELARHLRLGQLSTLSFAANLEMSLNYEVSLQCVHTSAVRVAVDGGYSRYAMATVQPLTTSTMRLSFVELGGAGGTARGTIHFRNAN